MGTMLQLDSNKERYFIELYQELHQSTKITTMEQYMQHGDTSCLHHSIAVAYYCYWFVTRMHIRCSERSLIRGALLHDYFLYDWHEKDNSHRLHGFHHPKRSLLNAKRDTKINAIEENMILHHMFPLTITPPTCREAVVICLIDKLCSIYELRRKRRYERLYHLVMS